jgi:hypothetical protein
MSTLPAWARRCPTCKRLPRGRRKPPTRVHGTTRADERAAKRAAWKAATAALREKVFARVGPDCELGQHGWPRYDVEMHHLVAGSAKRVTEDVSNTLRACTTCHRGWHQDGPLPFVATVKQWAALHSFPLPSIIRKAEASAQLPGRAAR